MMQFSDPPLWYKQKFLLMFLFFIICSVSSWATEKDTKEDLTDEDYHDHYDFKKLTNINNDYKANSISDSTCYVNQTNQIWLLEWEDDFVSHSNDNDGDGGNNRNNSRNSSNRSAPSGWKISQDGKFCSGKN